MLYIGWSMAWVGSHIIMESNLGPGILEPSFGFWGGFVAALYILILLNNSFMHSGIRYEEYTVNKKNN